jgi:F-type H+-transporting ATPase subunit b
MLGFDIPTFVFQIVNFLILLAILTKFFYRPVLDVMHRRQAQIDARISDAEQRARQADEEREKLARQSETATQEAAALIESARNEAASERQRLLAAAKVEAAALIDEARRTAASEEHSALDRLNTRLSESALSIAGTLIRESSGEAVHASLVGRLLTEGLGLDEAGQRQARLDFPSDGRGLVVESAYPLDASQEERLRHEAASILARPLDEVQIEVHQDESLIAGMRVLVGGLVVDLSVKHLLAELSNQEAEH